MELTLPHSIQDAHHALKAKSKFNRRPTGGRPLGATIILTRGDTTLTRHVTLKLIKSIKYKDSRGISTLSPTFSCACTLQLARSTSTREALWALINPPRGDVNPVFRTRCVSRQKRHLFRSSSRLPAWCPGIFSTASGSAEHQPILERSTPMQPPPWH